METVQIQIDEMFFHIMGDVEDNHFFVEDIIWKRFCKDGSITLINITEIINTFSNIANIQRITTECETVLNLTNKN